MVDEQSIERTIKNIQEDASSYNWMNDELRSSKFVPRYADKNIKVLAYIPTEMKYDKSFVYSIKHLLLDKNKERECNHQNFFDLKLSLCNFIEQDMREKSLFKTLSNNERKSKPKRKI